MKPAIIILDNHTPRALAHRLDTLGLPTPAPREPGYLSLTPEQAIGRPLPVEGPKHIPEASERQIATILDMLGGL